MRSNGRGIWFRSLDSFTTVRVAFWHCVMEIDASIGDKRQSLYTPSSRDIKRRKSEEPEARMRPTDPTPAKAKPKLGNSTKVLPSSS